MAVTVFDTETSGLNDPEVIQAAYFSVNKHFDYVDSYEMLFGCDKPIEWDAMGLHGITNEDVYGYAKWVGQGFLPEDTQYLVIHNASYDLKFLNPSELENVKVICTLKLARKLIDKTKCGSHKNSTLYYYLGCNKKPLYSEYLSKTHTALSDCVMTLNVFDQLLEQFNLTIEQAYQLVSGEKEESTQEDITICPFSKHKGIPWKQVVKSDKDYCQWLLNGGKIRNLEMVKYLKGIM